MTEETDLCFIKSCTGWRILRHGSQSPDSISPTVPPGWFVSPPDEGTIIVGKFTWRVLI